MSVTCCKLDHYNVTGGGNFNTTGIITCWNIEMFLVLHRLVILLERLEHWSVTNDGTVGGALTVTGDLTVNGTTTTIDTAVTSVDSLAVDGNITAGGTITTGDVTTEANLSPQLERQSLWRWFSVVDY